MKLKKNQLKRIKGKIKGNRNNEEWNKKTNWIKYEGHNWKKIFKTIIN